MRTGPRPTSGFTLTETLFVLMIVGVLASMITPLFATGRWRADSAVQEVAISLNAAQRLAVLRQHDVVVRFLLDQRRVRIHQDANNDHVEDPTEDTRVLELPETMGFHSGGAPALSYGAGPVSFAERDGYPTLTFHRNGSASATGVVYLAPVEGSLSGSPEAARAVTVERATAEVRCHTFRTGSWESSC